MFHFVPDTVLKDAPAYKKKKKKKKEKKKEIRKKKKPPLERANFFIPR